MKFCTLASSSSGNSLLVIHNHTRILIDAGISMRRIQNSLKSLDLSLEDLDGVFITHEHSDHICGIVMLCRKHMIPIYAPAGVITGIKEYFKGDIPWLGAYLNTIPVNMPITFGDITLQAFHTPHDVRESVGYRLEADGRAFAIATDLGHISTEVLKSLIGVNAAVLEANHDLELLKHGPYPAHLKARIHSDTGHLSNALCGKLAARLYKEGTTTIILAHGSKDNNTPELALKTVGNALTDAGAVPGKNMILLYAPRNECGPLLEV